MYTKGLQEYNALVAAYIIENKGPGSRIPDINIFEKQDEHSFIDSHPIFLDVVSVKFIENKSSRSAVFRQAINAFNTGKYDFLVETINIFNNRNIMILFLFKIIHGVIRSHGTEVYGDAKMTLDYYIYSLTEIALGNRETERAIKHVLMHIIELLEPCILLNKEKTYVNNKYIPANIYETNTTKLRNVFIKLGIPSNSLVNKLTFETATYIRISEDPMYKKALILMSLLYSMPGTGWAKKFIDVNLREAVLIFGNRVGEPLETMGHLLQGFGLEKNFIAHKILKVSFLYYIFTGNQVNPRSLNVLYENNETRPLKWKIVNTFSADILVDITNNQETIPFVDFIESICEIIDSITKIPGISMETYKCFAYAYESRFRLYREFLEVSDTITALNVIDSNYIDLIKSRINGLIGSIVSMQRTY